VVRASTAVPIYFPPMKLDDYLLVDGGVVANNLSEHILLYSLEHWGQNEEYYQLSLGTGTYYPNYEKSNGLFSWSNKIFSLLFNASSTYELTNVKKLGKFEPLKVFHRLNFELDSDIGLDDYTSFDKLDKMYNKWSVFRLLA
jgi:hypothetical protein